MEKRTLSRFVHSFGFKLFGAFALCIAILLSLNWLLNSFAFADYYEQETATVLTEVYEQLDTALHRGEKPNIQTDSADLSVLVWNDYRVLYSNQTGEGSAWNAPLPLPLFPSADLPNGTYTITNESDWMTLLGKTSGGLSVLLRTPLSNIRQSTAITNRFLLWSSLATLLVSCAMVLVVTRSFTRPVARLSRMAQRMATLDFRERYTGTTQDELNELGNSLNAVSETMEQSLSELKTANARLRNDVERKTQQDEARRLFISNVSHELKTPIALIQTYAEGLHESLADTAESREYYCGVIEDEAQHLSQIISKLTLLMQLESGKEELLLSRFDMHQLLTRILERNAPAFAERQVLPPALPDTSCFVWGDAVLIENVMTNYLNNALHHVDDGGTIRIGWEETDRRTARITVYNSGSTIPESDLPHIWESFYKVDKARTRAYGGSGIGLSVVAAIMQAHRMPFGVTTDPTGVTFFIELETR